MSVSNRASGAGGPSQQALEAAVTREYGAGMSQILRPEAIERVARILAAACDPSLGSDRLVRLGDVVEALSRWPDQPDDYRESHDSDESPAEYVERVFGASP